jgi:hypothetical protein
MLVLGARRNGPRQARTRPSAGSTRAIMPSLPTSASCNTARMALLRYDATIAPAQAPSGRCRIVGQAELRLWGESRLSLGRRMNASVGRRATDSRMEGGTGVALAARWPRSWRGCSEASFPRPHMAALTTLMPVATSETSSPKGRPTTKHLIIPPEEAADPLKPLTLLAVFEPRRMLIRRLGWSRRPAHSWRR